MTAITAGTVFGGCALLPGRAVQVCPHHGEALPISKPLKLAGAGPVLKWSFFHHCAPHQYAWAPMAFPRSPITNAPSPGAKATQVTVTGVEVIVPTRLVMEARSVSVPTSWLLSTTVATPLTSVVP